jgi:hypothetical protein
MPGGARSEPKEKLVSWVTGLWLGWHRPGKGSSLWSACWGAEPGLKEGGQGTWMEGSQSSVRGGQGGQAEGLTCQEATSDCLEKGRIDMRGVKPSSVCRGVGVPSS